MKTKIFPAPYPIEVHEYSHEDDLIAFRCMCSLIEFDEDTKEVTYIPDWEVDQKSILVVYHFPTNHRWTDNTNYGFVDHKEALTSMRRRAEKIRESWCNTNIPPLQNY
jgi:hypothetical protein